jgi:hypothetical protein
MLNIYNKNQAQLRNKKTSAIRRKKKIKPRLISPALKRGALRRIR